MAGKDNERALLLDQLLSRAQERKEPVEDSLRGAPEAAAELLPLLETARKAAGRMAPESPTPGFVKACEARLRRRIREAERKEARPRTFSFPALRRMPAAAAAFVLAAAVVLGSGWGVTAASATALPGDALFPVKRGVEQAELAFSTSATGDVALLAKFADRRLEEIEQLVQKSRPADLEAGFAEYEQALDGLDAAMQRLPADAGLTQLEQIQSDLDRHAEVLTGLRDQVPAQAQSALDRVMERSKKSKDLAEQLREEKGPKDLPPGQEKKTQEAADNGKTKTKNGKPADSDATKTPKPTHTEKPSNTPKPTKTEDPAKTPKPTDPPKPTKTEKPTKPAKTELPVATLEPVITEKPTKPPKTGIEA